MNFCGGTKAAAIAHGVDYCASLLGVALPNASGDSGLGVSSASGALEVPCCWGAAVDAAWSLCPLTIMYKGTCLVDLPVNLLALCARVYEVLSSARGRLLPARALCITCEFWL